ncbi:MAG: hypothetical protein JWM52_180 [Candidatus Saccharibacteria bacterium]|nr:hypothetical protein [Candidatus Saccharibacteria bacterium]
MISSLSGLRLGIKTLRRSSMRVHLVRRGSSGVLRHRLSVVALENGVEVDRSRHGSGERGVFDRYRGGALVGLGVQCVEVSHKAVNGRFVLLGRQALGVDIGHP